MSNEICGIQDDWLDGTPDCIEFLRPTIIAQKILKRTHSNNETVGLIYSALYSLFQVWKLEQGADPCGRGLLEVSKFRSKQEAEPWDCAGQWVVDPVDLFVELKRQDYQPIREFTEHQGEDCVLAAIALHYASISLPTRAYSDRVRGQLVAHKCITELAILGLLEDKDQIFAHEFAARFQDLKRRFEKRFRASDGSKGGLKKNELAIRLREKAIALFNEGKYPTLRNGAYRITDEVQRYGREELGFYLTTDDPENKVYKWILEAKKKGLIKR